jgi:hypothetical protein
MQPLPNKSALHPLENGKFRAPCNQKPTRLFFQAWLPTSATWFIGPRTGVGQTSVTFLVFQHSGWICCPHFFNLRRHLQLHRRRVKGIQYVQPRESSGCRGLFYVTRWRRAGYASLTCLNCSLWNFITRASNGEIRGAKQSDGSSHSVAIRVCFQSMCGAWF